MNKRLIIAITAIAIISILAMTFLTSNQDGTEKGDDESYVQKTVDAYLFGGTEGKKGTMDLRYYESQPNVPYAGLTDYYMKIQGVRMDVTQNGDGSFSVKNPKPNAVGATVDLS